MSVHERKARPKLAVIQTNVVEREEEEEMESMGGRNKYTTRARPWQRRLHMRKARQDPITTQTWLLNYIGKPRQAHITLQPYSGSRTDINNTTT